MKKFILLIVILLFVGTMENIVKFMIKDHNALIRFVGFALAIATVVFVLWLVLVIFFEYNFLNGLF